MPIALYSYKLRRVIPLLSDEEYRPIEEGLGRRINRIRQYRLNHGGSLEDAKRHSCDDLLDYYTDITGTRLNHPDELYHVKLSDYGRPCSKCRKPFRTPKAKLCAECGYELPEGKLAGPATLKI